MNRSLLTSLLVAAGFCAPALARANLAPVAYVDGHDFATESADVEIVAARIWLERIDAESEQPSGGAWRVESEYTLRNAGAEAVRQRLAFVCGATDAIDVRLDGRPITTIDAPLVRDPARPELSVDSAAIAEIDLAAGAIVTLRAIYATEGLVDSYGQVFGELPTHYLALWSGVIESAHIDVALDSRPFGLQTTLTNGVRYDDPENLVTWYLRGWEPAIPFRLSYLPSWTALQIMAEVEECPPAWRTVGLLTSGDITGLAAFLDGWDARALEFCASLPWIIHGRPFSPDVRAQLEQIALTRYVPGAPEGVGAYVENPGFDEGRIPEVEALYRRALTSGF